VAFRWVAAGRDCDAITTVSRERKRAGTNRAALRLGTVDTAASTIATIYERLVRAPDAPAPSWSRAERAIFDIDAGLKGCGYLVADGFGADSDRAEQILQRLDEVVGDRMWDLDPKLVALLAG
jgi:hypothetical protein